MGLLTALNAATSGLRVTQAGIDVVSQNVANADTAGYTRRQLAPVQEIAGDRTAGVRSGEIERVIDLVAQRQLRLETSGGSYTALIARFAGEIDRLFGEPGGAGSLDGAMNGFTQALQVLMSDPAAYAARSSVVDAGRALATRIASLADGVQSLRSDAERQIAADIGRANELLSSIADLNAKIVGSGMASPPPALLDERDRQINDLSNLIDVQVIPQGNGSVSLLTSGGLTLFDGSSAVQLTFDGRTGLTANSLWFSDDTARGVGTIKATTIQGSSIDIVANGMFRSGEIAAALELRDTTLVQVQRQLDELAAGLSMALSDRPDLVTAASAAGHSGFDFDMTKFAAGNVVTLDYQDTATTPAGAAKRILLVPTNGGVPVTQPNPAMSDPSALVIQAEVSGGLPAALASIASQLTTPANPAIAGRFTVTATSPTLRILDNTNTAILAGGNTATGFSTSPPQNQLPFFVDGGRGNAPYTGSSLGSSQLTGFAQRIAINPVVLADRSKLAVSGPGVPQGDVARPQFLLDALTKSVMTFSAATGIGGGGAPFAASVADFARRVVETQGANAEMAARLDEGQQIAVAAAQNRFDTYSGVNIDEQMAQLIQLQTAYGANARIITAVRDMLDMLMRI